MDPAATADALWLRRGDDLVPLVASRYELEEDLEAFLDKQPQLLPGALIDPASPRRWLRIHRQVPVPNRPGGGEQWTLDNLFCDQDAVLTLIEVKRSSDTRARREVVAQMLDYAANGSAFWTANELKGMYERHADARAANPELELAAFLHGDDDGSFWQTVETNLRSGRIRLVFVADRIADELRRIVEFLNEHMPVVDVLAVEVRQYLDEDKNTVLVPHVIGRTAAANDQKIRTTRRPFEDEWLDANDDTRRARALLDEWAARVGVTARPDKHLLRYHARRSRLVYLDPQGWIGFTRLAGLQRELPKEDVSRVYDALAAIAPTTAGQDYPVLTAEALAAIWPQLEETVLHPYLQLVRAADTPDQAP